MLLFHSFFLNYVLCLCMCTCECKCSREPEGGAGSLGTVAAGSRELSDMDAGTPNSGLLQEQRIPLANEPSLQPQGTGLF